jgi:hypothetical protein
MTRDQFIKTYTYGLDGNEHVPFDKFVALLDDLITRGCGGTQDLAANTVGLAAIGAGTGWVNIAVTNGANDIVHLPAVADVKIGHVVRGVCPATGCEIRVAAADDDVVALNTNHTTTHEAALAAGSSFEARLLSATNWTLIEYSSAGAFTAPTPD